MGALSAARVTEFTAVLWLPQVLTARSSGKAISPYHPLPATRETRRARPKREVHTPETLGRKSECSRSGGGWQRL